MAVVLATGLVELQPSARGFQRAVSRELGGPLKKSGEQAGVETSRAFSGKFTGGMRTAAKAGGVALAGAFTGAAILGKQAIDAASNLEETQSKVNTVFGDGAGIVNDWAKNAATAIGQSRQQALDAAGTFGNLFVQLGISSDKAADMSTAMVDLSSDFASFHNADITEVVAAQTAAFRGEYDALQRFVPTINAAAVEQKAMEMGLAATTGELDQQDKALATQQLMMEGAGDATGDFARTSDGLANQQRILAARFEDAKASIGKALIPAMTAVVGWVADKVIPAVQRLAETWMPRLKTGFEAVSDFVRQHWPTVQEVIGNVFEAIRDAWESHGRPALEAAIEASQWVVEWIRDNWPQIKKTAQDVFAAIGDAWDQYGKPAMAAVVDAVQWVATWIKDNWPQIKKTVSDVFIAIYNAYTTYLKTVFTALVAAGEWVVAWIRDNWPQISSVISGVFQQVKEIIAGAVEFITAYVEAVIATVTFIWRNFGDELVTIFRGAWKFVTGILSAAWTIIKGIVQGAIDVVHGIIRTVMSLIRGDWGDAWDGIKQVFSGVWDAIQGVLDGAVAVLERTLGAAVDTIQLAWQAIDGVYHWFRDEVYQPVVDKVGEFRDTVARIVGEVVSRATGAWEGIRAIVDFFRESVYDPVMRRVNQLKEAIGTAFEKAVDGVKTAWDLLKSVVKAPINVVIGFYNNGIRKLWNNIISKIPGIGDLPEVAKFAKGGRVPGTGNGDTVPAMLTPGEFVVTKKAASKWGPGVLEMLNNPSGSIDPGIFGYQAGGYVRSADEALEWARQQGGKPYKFPLVGPDAYDCSGFTSALINYILGKNPHSRRHSSGSMASDPALARGGGDNPMGALFGARPPYMINSSGASVGHTTATLMGVNMEATPPRVKVGGGARGASAMSQLFHLPGYGGLSASDELVAASMVGMHASSVSSGGNYFGDILDKLVNKLPGMIYDFFITKLPEIIIKAIKDTLNPLNGLGLDHDLIAQRIRESGGTVPPGYADGGRIGRNGPILVGERGPELMWGSRGQYVESNDELRSGIGGDININVNHAPFDLDRAVRQARLMSA